MYTGLTHTEPTALTASVRVPLEARQSKWCVAYIQARHEKIVAQHLSAFAVENFLPVYQSVRNWNGRRAEVALPLFPCYIFVRIQPSERLRVLETPGVVHLVCFNGTPAILPDEEIEGLRNAVQVLRARPHEYVRPGDRVRINAGPLRGLDGVVVREKNATRVVVSVDCIMRSFVVEIDAGDLESR
jgi:transcription antitermination factor NusG